MTAAENRFNSCWQSFGGEIGRSQKPLCVGVYVVPRCKLGASSCQVEFELFVFLRWIEHDTRIGLLDIRLGE